MRKSFLAATLLAALGALPSGGCADDDDSVASVDSDSDVDTDTETSTDPADDNDGDGLTNGEEEALGTDPNVIDSDGDGFSDFIEAFTGTNPLSPGENPRAEGDFVFISPYIWEPSPQVSVLVLTIDAAAAELAAAISDDATDDEDATALMQRISPNTVGGVADPFDPDVVCAGGLATEDDDGDSIPDRFVDLAAGTTVCFDIVPARNETIPPTSAPRVYGSFLDVVADDATILESRDVYFYVPI